MRRACQALAHRVPGDEYLSLCQLLSAFFKKLIILAIALGTEHGKCDFMTICILQTLRLRALLACPLSH